MARKKTEQFEDALQGLQEIVERLERGDLSLEEAMEAFTEGMRLAQMCHRKLEEAETKVQTLLKDRQGEWTTLPMPPGSSSSE